ncbi:hypothetical protein EYC84_004755 [Monilinia fructicola]|uniref:Uncharacterized protein n=1 Tax=Monilinia fructicola TaxID=38448 RepID=A0A5M9K279_MONFR|nr:hypothetical protein EYC84_004755 [Monilinia fructicola]
MGNFEHGQKWIPNGGLASCSYVPTDLGRPTARKDISTTIFISFQSFRANLKLPEISNLNSITPSLQKQIPH